MTYNNCFTEAVQQTTYSPVFDYSRVHHVSSVTQEFIDFLKGSVEMQIHVSQHIDPPADKIIQTGEPKGYEHVSAKRPKTDAEIRCDTLTEALAQAEEMNQTLRARIAELELRVQQLEGTPKMANSIREAQLIDSIVNGPSE